MENYFFFYFIIEYIFILPSFIKYTGESPKSYMTISLGILHLEPKAISMQSVSLSPSLKRTQAERRHMW